MKLFLTEIKETIREVQEDPPHWSWRLEEFEPKYETETEVYEIDVDGFRELVDHLVNGGYVHPSNYPATGSVNEWITSEPWEEFGTGDEVRHSLHFCKSNPEWTHKYWKKALAAIGIKIV